MKHFKCLILLAIIFLSCSCVKYETNVTIASDKSVNFEIKLGYDINSNKSLDINEVKDIVSPLGFFVDSYHDNNYTGYRLSKKYKSMKKIYILVEVDLQSYGYSAKNALVFTDIENAGTRSLCIKRNYCKFPTAYMSDQ